MCIRDRHLEASLKRHAKDVKDMNAYMEGNDKESPIRPEQLTTALNLSLIHICTG